MRYALDSNARRAFTGAIVGIALAGATLGAQARPTYTLGEFLNSLDVAATVAQLGASNPVALHVLDSTSAMLFADGNTSLTVAQVAERIQGARGKAPTVSWSVVNRTDRSTAARAMDEIQSRAFADEVWTAIGLGNVEITRALQGKVSRDSMSVLLRPLDAMNAATLRVAHDNNQQLLKHFEKKYGPKSASLNIVEVGLNYVAQFNLLRTTETSGPSPFEIIANYGVSSLRVGTTDNDPNKVVTNGRAGFRYYFFGDDWGGNGRFTQYLKPAYMSMGVITTGPDGNVGRVWGRGYHAGPFIGWGDFFGGYLIDPKRRIILGVQKTLIPGVL